ncbi:hypothetical protein F383_30379 [Gossypium arboreum]|uniref:Uncharacterized protein n=1 Tax=Gossypium arboreum TaxID=29729 RepID=A0A0B0MYG1_GOSAR|nr:hypothetical protein F383_30379 [Gossypium arboreum]
MLESLLGVGLKFHHLSVIFRFGVIALLIISLFPQYLFVFCLGTM